MAAITFDTLAYSKKLRTAGFTEQQAEVAAEAQKETIEVVIAELESRHLNEMATKRDLAEVKAELVRWVVAAGFLQTVLIAALLMKLIK
jgi:folate-dependent phosphoribosylglycinamide formyltransferase PurN